MSSHRFSVIPVALRRLTTVFQDFGPGSRPASARTPAQIHMRGRMVAAVGLLTGGLIAVTWANSPWSGSYSVLRDTELLFGPVFSPIRASFRLFINNFLMTLFFLSVGLSVRRQVALRGGGPSLRMPLAAALASIFLPVVILFVATRSLLGPWGWLVALGADLGFVASALALAGVGETAPARRFTLTCSAAGDMVAVIALFLLGGAFFLPTRFLLTLVVGFAYALAARAKWFRAVLLVISGFIFWACWSAAGLPPALAGAFLALFAANRPEADERITADAADKLLDRYDDAVDDTNGDRCSALAAGLGAVARRAEPEVDRWQRRLLPWIALVVMPLFGWANAGVVLDHSGLALVGVVTGAFFVAMLLGKPAGFLAMSWFFSRRGRGGSMDEVPLREVFGLSLLSAAGGAMSAYAAVCVIPPGNARDAAVVSILIVSVIATLIGAVVARRLKIS